MLRSLLRIVLVLAAFACGFGASSAPAQKTGARRPTTVTFSTVFKLASGGKKGSLTLWSMVPRTIPGVQEVISLQCTPKPEEMIEKDGERVAEFEIPDLPDKCEVRIRVKMKIWPHDFQAAAKQAKRKKKKRGKKGSQQQGAPSATQLAPWLAAGDGFDLESPAVKSLVRRIHAKGDLQKVRQIHALVLRKLEPRKHAADYAGAAAVATAGKGDTIDYTDLFVALCRAKGVPARFVEGLIIPFHGGAEYAWPEVYLERYGWVYFDLLSADQRAASFEKIDNRFVKLSNHRGSPLIDDEHFWRYAYAGESITVNTEVVVH